MTKVKFKEFLIAYFPRLSTLALSTLMEKAESFDSDKGTQIIEEGKRHNYIYILIKGSAKAYYLKDGKEVCSWFVFENDLIATLPLLTHNVSLETVELLEDSELIRINIRVLLELAENDLTCSQLISKLLLEHAGYLEHRLYQIQFQTSKERFQQLMESNPQVFQKVSLTDIASFLGITRETLSRIRATK